MASIKDIMADIKRKANSLTTEVVKETLQDLHDQSPVDTGRFRHSWRIGEGIIDRSVEPEGEHYPFPAGYAGQAEAGQIYYLTNSLDYAIDLSEGSSRQASAGWIPLIGDSIPAKASDITRGLRS